jgi:F0F1-type ATP synthase assembly protein I
MPDRKNTSSKPDRPPRSNALMLISIAWQMIGTVLLCLGLGWLFEKYVYPDSKPWAMLGFTFFGVIASMVLVIREVSRMK